MLKKRTTKNIPEPNRSTICFYNIRGVYQGVVECYGFVYNVGHVEETLGIIHKNNIYNRPNRSETIYDWKLIDYSGKIFASGYQSTLQAYFHDGFEATPIFDDWLQAKLELCL